MLAYKKATCASTECSRDADVAVVLRAHKKDRVRNKVIRERVGVAPVEIRVHLAYLHITSINDLTDKVISPQHVFGLLV